MSTPLTPERLAEIAALVQAATEGPWRREDDAPSLTRLVVSDDSTLVVSLGYVGNRTQDDAAFIAAARTAVPELLAEVERLTAELAKYVGHEPTLTEEALYAHEEKVRARIAQDVNRAERPTFAEGERTDLVVRTTRAIDIRLIELGDQAPYWVAPDGGAR